MRKYQENYVESEESGEREFWVAFFNIPHPKTLRGLKTQEIGRLVRSSIKPLRLKPQEFPTVHLSTRGSRNLRHRNQESDAAFHNSLTPQNSQEIPTHKVPMRDLSAPTRGTSSEASLGGCKALRHHALGRSSPGPDGPKRRLAVSKPTNAAGFCWIAPSSPGYASSMPYALGT